MIWSWLTRRNPERRAEAMRRTHSRFLSAAVLSADQFPRIPVRRVDQGGFATLMSRPRGRAAAAAWWNRAFEKLPDSGDA